MNNSKSLARKNSHDRKSYHHPEVLPFTGSHLTGRKLLGFPSFCKPFGNVCHSL